MWPWNQRALKKRDPRPDCASSAFASVRLTGEGPRIPNVLISRQRQGAAFFFESSLFVDADGAPSAYHPDNRGLDDLANAGHPGAWDGLADYKGVPYIQGPNDPFPGFYVSTTDLVDQTRTPNDPARYVDAFRIPYIVLPEEMETQMGVRPGDFAIVFNLRNGRISPAIYADTGPPIGEGSIALARNLKLWPDARRGGTTRGILYLVFPGSGNGRPRSIDEINAQAKGLFRAWGGNKQLIACGVR